MRNAWDMRTLDDLINDRIVELGRGKVISKKDLANYPGNYPVYSSAKNNEGKFGEYGKFMFDEELITWSVDGGGRLFYRPKHRFSITNVGGYIRIRRPDVISYRFLYFCLSLLHSRIDFDWVKKAHPSVIRKLYKEIPLPPLPEQKRIVAILDEAFAGIDAAIANTEKNLANARELFESYLNAIFTRKSDNWIEKQLGDVCDFLNGFAFKSADTVEASNVQLLRMGNLYQNKLDLSRKPVFYPDDFQDAYKRYVLSEGDLIMSLTGTVDKEDYGYAVEVPKTEVVLLLNQRIAKFFNIDTDYVDRKFFLYLLRSKPFLSDLYKTARGVRQANLSSTSMKKIKIGLPPIELQKSLVETFRSLEIETQRLEAIYQQKLTALAELKQSLLQKAFSGELTADATETVGTMEAALA